MREGYRIIDTDTHVGPTADVLYEFGSSALLARREELKPYEREFRDGIGLSISPYPYKRKMGEPAFAEEAEKGGTPALTGAVGNNRVELPEPDVQQRNSEGRLRDMDREGRDVDLVVRQDPQQVQPARGAQELEDLGGVVEDVASRCFAASRLGHDCLRTSS